LENFYVVNWKNIFSPGHNRLAHRLGPGPHGLASQLMAWRLCNGCNKERLPEGGVPLSPTRWLCAACWAKFNQRKFK
jgi:hypothetical protein